MSLISRLGRLAVTACVAAILCGCHDLSFIWETEQRDDVDLGVRAEDLGPSSAALKNTLGEAAYYEGTGPLRVRGYGLVMGLGNKGSRECPGHIYKDLVQSMYKHFRFSRAEVGVKSMTPEQLINSEDTAVVTVQGQIDPGATAGTRIDVVVQALPGTQSESLWGGYLFPMDLELFSEIPEKGTISGRAMAKATGPLFINPFSDDDSATKANPLVASILGGGVTLTDRDIRLVLTRPSYQLAKRIQDRINGRFGAGARLADAVSPSFIRIKVPDEYRHDTAHFLALVRALYLSREPRFESVKLQQLAREITEPDAGHARIALSFEGIGNNALPTLKELYTHEKPYVSFYAAAAGLRLGDHLAGDVMAQHANNPESTFRYQAIRALGLARDIGATAVALRKMLDNDDPRVKIAAYEALLKRGDATIQSVAIGRSNFRLDLVPSREPTIYCKRTGEQRIAVFGLDTTIRPPVFYLAPDGSLMLNADPAETQLTAVRRSDPAGATSPPLALPLEVPKFIRLCGHTAGIDRHDEITGLGLAYGSVVRALHALCNDGAIPARFIVEQPNMAELFGPSTPMGRPESDLSSSVPTG